MDNTGAMSMDMDLISEMTAVTADEAMIATLSPTLFDLDSLADSCVDDGLALDADNFLPDLSSLEDFVDLTEFFVSVTVCN